jgi:hypothetical protein
MTFDLLLKHLKPYKGKPTKNAMLTIITPCGRPENLKLLEESLDLDRVQWLIVYDTKNGPFTPKYNHPKIREIGHPTPPGGCAGHAQRNAGMSEVVEGFIYFLDDDTVMHPAFWKILPLMKDEERFYTFDQQRWDEFVAVPGGIFKGDVPAVSRIDSAQFVVPRHMCRQFIENDYRADGFFIAEVNNRFPGAHMYIPTVASYYNFLRK